MSRNLHSGDIPRSPIYVSGKSDTVVLPTYKFKNAQREFDFFLILTAGVHYTQEDILEAKGKYKCYNCSRPIMKEIYFMVEHVAHQTQKPILNVIPHCRDSCLYRTIQDIPNNSELLTNFFLVFGHDIICAPERFLLYIPGGLDIDQYHHCIDEKLVIQKQSVMIRGVFSPVYISSYMFTAHQLHPETVAFLDELQADGTKSSMAPTQHAENGGSTVTPLPPKKLTQTRLATTFPFDEASFHRNAAMEKNVHFK